MDDEALQVGTVKLGWSTERNLELMIMATDEEELTEEKCELVGEWEPMIFNEFALSLAHRKKGR